MSAGFKRKIYFYLRSRIHRLPQVFREQWQARELRRIVRDAYENVPFYRELWTRRGAHPRIVRNLDDIKYLPVIDKALLRQYPISKLAHRKFPEKDYLFRSTSGSAGEPFKFISSRLYTDIFHQRGYMELNRFRFLLLEGVRFGNILKMKVAKIGTDTYTRPNHLFIPIDEVCRNPNGVVKKLRKFKPDIFESRASIILELAWEAARLSKNERLNIPYIVSHGDTVQPAARNFICDIFGSEMYDRYGLEEVGGVGIDCREHNGFHLYEESCLVEILDSKDGTVSPGGTGRVVVTSFFNSIMPFIRYDTSDLGAELRGTCPCGVLGRRIVIHGRTNAFLNIGKRKFHSSEFDNFFRHFSSSILQFQLAKREPDEIELRLVPTEFPPEFWQESLRKAFLEKFNFEPKIRTVERISYAKSGKTSLIVNDAA